MATNYRRGADFERRVREDMAGRGYLTVRAAGSHTPADVYCFAHGDMAFVQCKTDGRLDPTEWNEFLVYCWKAGAKALVAMKGEKGRGIRYMRITATKSGGGAQPWQEWDEEA